MEFFRIRRDIPFMRMPDAERDLFVTFAAAVFFLVTRGLHLSVEFTGGTVMEVAYPAARRPGGRARRGRSLGYAEVPGAELRHGARRADAPAGAGVSRVGPAERAGDGGAQGTTPAVTLRRTSSWARRSARNWWKTA
jgi:preprotein translocase subunit SecF